MTKYIPQILCIGGLSLVSYGLWIAWHPLGYAGAGGLLTTCGVWLNSQKIRPNQQGNRR